MITDHLVCICLQEEDVKELQKVKERHLNSVRDLLEWEDIKLAEYTKKKDGS